MGGSRGVGNPVCPHEELATIVGKCWVIHAFKAGGAKAPTRPQGLALYALRLTLDVLAALGVGEQSARFC